MEFAYQVKSASPEEWIFWVEGTDRLTFEKDVLEIGKRLNIPGIDDDKADVKNLVKQRLSAGTERWVLILDNADEDALWGQHADAGTGISSLAHHLPRTTSGFIVITTRTPSVAAFLSGKDVIELPMMSPDDGIQMFTQALRKPDLAMDLQATLMLLEELAYLPLAIIQAASYLNMTGRTVQTYLRLLDKPEEEVIKLLSKDFEDSTRYANAKNPVASTWLISLNHLRKHHELAAKFLSSMVCLSEKSIPQSLLPENKSEVDTIDAIAILIGYSFVSRHSGGEGVAESEETYDLHRIVHLAGRNWLRNEGSLADWTRKTIERMAKLFPTRDYQHKSIWTAYLPHAKRLCDDHEGKDIPARYELLGKMGSCFVADGKFVEAVEAQKIVAEWKENAFGASDLRTLVTYDDLGEALREMGDWTAAEEYLQKAIEIQKTILEPDHPLTLSIMNNLASTYSYQGRFQEAEELETKVLAVRKRLLGETNSLTLTTASNLALTYWHQGRWKDSEELHLQVMASKSTTLGLEHPSTLATMDNLAAVYRSQGRWKEAERLLTQEAETTRKVMGEEHPNTLNSLDNLAKTYVSQGRWTEAEDLHSRVLEVRQKLLKENHPDILSSQACLARVFWYQDRLKEAEELFGHVLEIRRGALGEEHHETLTAMSNLASTYLQQGQLAEAEKLLAEVIEISKRVVGEEHEDTLSTMASLASTYRNQGLWNRAEELFLQVIEIRKRVCGDEHPETLISIGNLALTYCGQDRYEEAEALELQVMEAMERTLGAEHPQTLTIMGNLAMTYSYYHEWDEAERLLKHVMETRKRVLEDHAYTANSIEKLAGMYRKQGGFWQRRKAKRLEIEAKEMRDRIQLLDT